ncbi:sigma factor [Streptomyces sp. NBC_00304]|uniref:sigma factor n=1 Tax=Streptomyces sp. NBC_00304 TaxID=2975706 RepID=UPI002E2A320C|nr:sigma factor [Streptomyces sp. NBC_00304]
MDEIEFLAARFEENRTHLKAVAHRMLGSSNEAEDAVQEAWIRLSRSDSAAIENLGGWLTTVVGRVCLDMLCSRRVRREVVDAFLAAARGGDFEALVAVLDPDVVSRSGGSAVEAPTVVRGAANVARRAIMFAPYARSVRFALLDGAPAVIAAREGEGFSVMRFTIERGKVVELFVITDPAGLAGRDLVLLDE